MGKLSDWSYPYIKVSRAFDIAHRICGSPYNGEISVSGLAQELHLKEGTGGFGNLVKSLKDYGLVIGRGTLKATELAKKIAVGTAEEASVGREESFLKIGLFKEINKRIGIQAPDRERFSTLLGEITKADRLEIIKRTPTVRNLYLDGCRYLKPEKKPEKEGNEVTTERTASSIDTSMTTSTSVEEQANIVKGLIKQGAYDIAKNFIDFIKTKKEEETTPEEEG